MAAVPFIDYYKAFSCKDQGIRRIRLNAIQQRVNLAASQKRQKALKRELDRTHQAMLETSERARREEGLALQRRIESLQEQARQNNLYRGNAGRPVVY